MDEGHAKLGALYDAVEKSTGFAPPPADMKTPLPGHLRRIADEARPYYEMRAKWNLAGDPAT